jgi:hypothetical protein
MPLCSKKNVDEKVLAYKNRVDTALNDVTTQIDACTESMNALQKETEELKLMLEKRYKQQMESATKRKSDLKNIVKNLEKLKKNKNIELVDIVLKENDEAMEASIVVETSKETKKREKEKVVTKSKKKSKIEFDPVDHAALLVSINDTKKESGTAIMKDFLMNNQGFKESDIIILSNKNATKMNILKSMDDVIATALDKGFKEVLFYYSGNGINVSNAKKEEYEDIIMPYDYKSKGFINSETFNTRFEAIKEEEINVSIILDCEHVADFMENNFEYRGSIDKLHESEVRNYTVDIVTMSLSYIDLKFKKKGIMENKQPHILAKAFIEHYGECVEEERSEITMISMLHDIRDYLVYHETDLMPVLSTCGEVQEESCLLKINNQV